MKKRVSTVGALLAGCFVLAGSAAALPLIIDYTGFTWAAPSAGSPEQFFAVGVVDGYSAPIQYPAEVYTFYISNLSLANVVEHSSTRRTYVYGGGEFGFYRSTDVTNRGYDYGESPFNPTSPSSFTDGVLWLGGGFSSFSVFVDEGLKLGGMSAAGSFQSGEMYPNFAESSFFAFAGMTARTGSGIPDGYGYRMDGQMSATSVPVVPEPSTVTLLALGAVGIAVGYIRRRRA